MKDGETSRRFVDSCVTRCLHLDAGGPPVHAARAQQRDLAEADSLTNQR